MKDYLLESAKIVGTATEKSWSQVHLFSPAEKEKFQLRGELLAVLSLSGLGEGIEAVAAGREIISRLHEEYYGNLEGSAFARLTETVQKVCSESKDEAKIEIAAAVVVGKILYLAIKGQGKVILFRDGKVGLPLAGDGKLKTASGYLKDNDLVLIGTAGFFQGLPMGVLKAALTSGSPSQAAEAIAPIIHGQSESGTKAAVIFTAKKSQVKIEPTTPVTKIHPSATTSIQNTPSLVNQQPATKTNQFAEPFSRIGKILSGKFQSRLLAFFMFIQKRLRSKTIYLKRETLASEVNPQIGPKPPRSKKTIFTIVIILLLILGISVGLGAHQRKNKATKQGVTALLESARQKKAEAESQLDLNPSEARRLLLEAADLVKQIESQKYSDSEFDQFKKDLDKVLASVVKEYPLEAKTFFDLGLLRSGAKGDDWTFSGDKLIILDSQQPSVYEIGINDSKTAILTGGKNLSGGYLITAYLPKIYTLTSSGIMETDKITKKEKLVAELKSEEKMVDLAAFSGNLYLLKPSGEIGQYLITETGFSPYQNWLKDDVSQELAGAVSMAIDGSIWALKSDGQVLKLTRGRKEKFNLASLNEQIKVNFPSQPKAIYTHEDSENLYLLDLGIPGVIILNKTGEYQATYILTNSNSEIGLIKNLVADENGKKIFLLGESKIYEIEMK